MSEQASAVIHNSIVFEQTQEDSLTDPLTGLPNTRFMFMHLTRELARAARLRSEVSLLVLDLDRFKDINDTHGHHVGDRALREVYQAYSPFVFGLAQRVTANRALAEEVTQEVFVQIASERPPNGVVVANALSALFR